MMNAIQIGSRREVCWDEYLMERAEGIRVQMHHPEYRGVVMNCDEAWEGCNGGYFTVIREAEYYRIYYRGSNGEMVDSDGCTDYAHKSYFCCAESADGKQFTRVPVNEIAYMGIKQNNIILEPCPTNPMDNVFFFCDKNPACPPEERYKALTGSANQELIYYKSADGVHFEQERVLVDDGAYDSLNVCFWDEATKQYFLFYRGLHGEGGENGKWNEYLVSSHSIVRDVRVRTSEDFLHWGAPQMIEFAPERDDLQLYTNQVQKYYRASHMFIGFPTRYVDRYQDYKNYPQLPDWKHRQKVMEKVEERSGTAMTDTAIMTSRDGLHFRRTEEAFMTPGIERDCNWYYGDCYFAHGMIETKSDLPGAPNEISMYVGRNLEVGAVELCRYALRLDGFFSWRCDYTPGTVLTKPLIFDGDQLSVNFATSALGYVRIRLTDAMGAVLEGYDSGKLFGNSVDRVVEFDKPLSALLGKEVRMEITMSDADLYAFQFSKPWHFNGQ